MVYREHGLTVQQAVNSAFKEAKIEVEIREAPIAITTDAICTIDTTEHDAEIGAVERRKFAEWLSDNFGLWDCYGAELEINEVIAMYEKETKNV